MAKDIFINYIHYKGGTYNLIVVFDDKGRFATSLKDAETAIKNFHKKYG